MADEHKSKRVRSPAYPSIGLRAAIEQSQIIYDHEKRNAAPVGVVAKHCGTDIKSSGGLRLIAALKQYGLAIEEGGGDDRHVRLSDRALDILLAESENSQERLDAIKAAALAPKIHRKLWEHYDGKLPSEPTLKMFLIRKLEFNDSTVGKFIKQFFATIAFANLVESDTMDENDGNHSDEDITAHKGRENRPPNTNWGTGNAKMRELPITLPSLNIAVVKVPERMSLLDFDTLLKSVTEWKAALVAQPSDNADEPPEEVDE